MGFITTAKILTAHKHYGFFPLIVWGMPGCGKSTFAIKLLAQVYGECELDTSTDPPKVKVIKPNWNAWKDWMVFYPQEFKKKVDETVEKKKQEKCIVWDDAGLWVSHRDRHHPFVKQVAGALNVVRTSFASVIFTTIDPGDLLKSIREMPGMHTGSPTKISGAQPYHRTLRVYERWVAPDTVKRGVKPIYEERYNIWLPDDVFEEYDKVRREYIKVKLSKWEDYVEDLIDEGKVELARKLEEAIATYEASD